MTVELFDVSKRRRINRNKLAAKKKTIVKNKHVLGLSQVKPS